MEVCATQTHLDYHSESVVADLQGWLAESGLAHGSLHAPVSDRFTTGRPGQPLNLASPDPALREHAVDEVTRALHVARRLPYEVLVVHAGVPRAWTHAPGENNRDAARRSIETLATSAEPLGVTVAVELLPNELSTSGSLVHFIEDVLDCCAVAICLDLGHAHLERDVVDVIDTVSEHIALVHVHDNRGRHDDHLLPFEGGIEWPAALTSLQKVGCDERLVLEVAPHGSTRDTLSRARSARARMDRLLADP